MSSNTKSQNEGESGSQSQRNNASTSSGVGTRLGNIISRENPSKRPEPFPQLGVERSEGTTQRNGEWEDLPERHTRTASAPRSIMHTPSTLSRDNRVSFEGDRKTTSEGHSRRDRSQTGSARSGRGVGEFVSSILRESTRAHDSASTVMQARSNISPSPTRRQPVPANKHPLARSHNSPPNEGDTFLDPGNAPLETADFDPSRPRTPDDAWGEAEIEALRTRTGDGDAARANPDASGAPATTAFDMQSVPPFDVDPLSPLAERDPNFVPSRTIGQSRQGGNGSGSGGGSASPKDKAVYLTANAAKRPGATAMGSRGGGHLAGGRLSPQQPRREPEILPPKTRRPAGASGHGPTRNLAHGGHHRPGDRERRERQRQRQRELGAEPYRPLDPYAYPPGQKKSPIPPFLAAVRWAVDWTENNLGLAQEEGDGELAENAEERLSQEGESIPMTGRRGPWLRRPRRGTRPAKDRPSTSEPTNETESARRARERGETEARTTRVGARRLEREIHERNQRLAIEEVERGRHRRLSVEEIKEELEHGLPVVPRTSPTRRRPRPAGTPLPTTRPAAEPRHGVVESAPVVTVPGHPGLEPGSRPGQAESNGSGRPTPAVREKGKAGTLSPPKASPQYHPPSDPGSPVKHTSPFNLGAVTLPAAFHRLSKADLGPIIIEAGEQVELTLREWMGSALVQAYRHLLLRMPSLYFNRVGRVFTEAEFSEMELTLLLHKAAQEGPNSLTARIIDHRSPWRGYGGLRGVGNEENLPLLRSVTGGVPLTGLISGGGHDSNSPSPNRRPLPLENTGIEDNSDLEAGSAFGGGSTLAGQGASGAQEQITPEVKESLAKLERFRIEWEGFIDGMVKEWKTLNVVSALLLSALLTTFQIQEAANVPVTRTAALLSLVSAFMSLLFGGVYIIRFSTMRTMRKAARWVQDTHKKEQKILWNIWILLSLPVTWLVYSLIFFCIAILGFVWTSGTGKNISSPSSDDHAAVILGPRIGVTVLFFIGFIYFCLVLNTFRVWSGVTVGSNNDTLINIHSPYMGNDNSRLDSSALARGSGDRPDEQLPPVMPKEINELSTFPLSGRAEGGDGLDGLQALASQNTARETREQRNEDIARGLEGVTARSVDSAPSMLGLDLTPPVESRPAVFRHSPNVLLPALTSTPPRLVASDLAFPNTIVTEPTPVTHQLNPPFVTDASSSAPLTAVDPLMDSHGPLGLQDPIPVNSPPFTRHIQALGLDDELPDRRTPPSTLTSEYATPIAESISEFGTLQRGNMRMGRGS